MSHYAVIRFEKHKTTGSINTVGRHNTRDYTTHAPENVNRDMSRYNETLVACHGPSLAESVNAEIQARVTGLVRPDSVRMLEFIMTSDQEFFLPASDDVLRDASGRFDADKLDAWKNSSLEYIQRLYGAENVVSAVLHVDERTPHIHACVVPITSDGRLCAREWTGGKQKLRQIQSGYAEAMAHLGLVRGREYSTQKHRTMKEYYAALSAELEVFDQLPPELGERPGLLAGAEAHRKYKEAAQQREDFIEKMRKTGDAFFARAAAYDAVKRDLDTERDLSAHYRRLYEETKAKLDTKTLRALDLATVARRFGYYHEHDDKYIGHMRDLVITGQKFEFFGEIGKKRKTGKNAIDFVKAHIELEENREVTPAEAIVRLAGVAGDARQVEDTVKQAALDEAEAQLAPLRPQFAAAVEAEKARQEERKRKEKREAEAARQWLAEQEAAAEARQQMEHQPGQQQPEPEPEPTPPPQLETPPPPAPEPEPEPEPAPEEPEPGMSM